MRIFDAHCDVLMKLFLDRNLLFTDHSKLQVSYQSLVHSPGSIQCFAVYIPEAVHPDLRYMAALAMIDIFYEKVLYLPNVKLIKSKKDIDAMKKDEIGAVLTLEGCDCVGGDLLKLSTLIRLGVSSVGLTWNYGNLAADGALEKRNSGLSIFGEHLVRLLNNKSIWTDVSHLSEHSFWDVLELADYPIASHSNVYKLCPHPRNLRDDQIKALLKKQGMIGIAFFPDFLRLSGSAQIKDILNHLDYICGLGGENQVGFGSDFDGIDRTVENLASYEGYGLLIEELEKHYSADLTKKITFMNFASHFPER